MSEDRSDTNSQAPVETASNSLSQLREGLTAMFPSERTTAQTLLPLNEQELLYEALRAVGTHFEASAVLLSRYSRTASEVPAPEVERIVWCCDEQNDQTNRTDRELRIDHDILPITSRIDGEIVLLDPVLSRQASRADGNTHLPLALPIVVSDRQRSRIPAQLRAGLAKRGITSCAVVGYLTPEAGGALIEIHLHERRRQWRREEIVMLRDLAQICGPATPESLRAILPRESKIGPIPVDPAKPLRFTDSEVERRYRRLVELGNVLIVRTDSRLRIVEVVGDTEGVLGVNSTQLIGARDFWQRMIAPDDLRAIVRKLRSMRRAGTAAIGISEEVRITHQRTAEVRWLMMRAAPILDDNGVIGWEATGFDITATRRAQEEALLQSKRIQALYAVSRVAPLQTDPAIVTLKGLRALVAATGSDSGLCCFFHSNSTSNQDAAAEGGALEIIASEGLSEFYVSELSKLLHGPVLIRRAVESRQGILVNNIQRDSRAAVELAKREGLRATLIMPLLVEDTVLGALVLFCKRPNRYTGADYDVVSAAAQQMALQIRQTEHYANEKRQSHSMSVLYRLSHELSKFLTPRDVAEHAFPIILNEFAPKRMWCGIINEQGTALVGTAGHGPGIRSNVIAMRIELRERHDGLDLALKDRIPVVLSSDQLRSGELQCTGLGRFVQRLEVSSVAIIPMVSLGSVVGVLFIEPGVANGSFSARQLQLLSSIAAEMGTVILARRFEARMAEADKMRMAGLLASGVAHNFNNLLQAVMGQASLIEMQLPAGSPLTPSARMIVDAAGRGAGLIKQLLTFTVSTTAAPRKGLELGRLLEESRELYQSLLGATVAFSLNSLATPGEVMGDFGQLQQVLTNLLVNAKEAVAARRDGRVQLRLRSLLLQAGEIDPDLSPGNYLCIEIDDNGVGMDREKQARCFEPFFTTKNVDARTGLGLSGSGLGLSSVYSIVKSHGGSVTVQSEVGRGTVFSVYLPVLDANLGESEVDQTLGPEGENLIVGLALDHTITQTLRAAAAARHAIVRICGQVSDLGLLSTDDQSKNAGAMTVVLDLDHFGTEGLSVVNQVLAQSNVKLVVAMTHHRARLEALLEPRIHGVDADIWRRVRVLEKPVALWSLHSVLRSSGHSELQNGRLVSAGIRTGLQKDQVQKETNQVEQSTKNADTELADTSDSGSAAGMTPSH